jgi:hypothetical protein
MFGGMPRGHAYGAADSHGGAKGYRNAVADDRQYANSDSVAHRNCDARARLNIDADSRATGDAATRAVAGSGANPRVAARGKGPGVQAGHPA